MFSIKYVSYKNAHDRTIFIFCYVIIFWKIGCANLDDAPISPLLPYTRRFVSKLVEKVALRAIALVSRGQSSFVRYEHFARWSGRFEHYRPLKRAVWTFRPILTPRHNWLYAALRTSMQCDFFRPFGHKRCYVLQKISFKVLYSIKI